MKKRIILLLTVMTLGVLCTACNEKGSDEPISVSEEIALSVSEESVPDEAYNYTKVSFDVPESMIADADNTEDSQYYLASDAADLSFISYIKAKKDSNVDFASFTSDSFKNSLENQLQTTVTMKDFMKEEADGYSWFKAVASYTNAENNYELTAYIFVTDEYIFSVDFCLAGTQSSKEAIINAEKSLRLESIAKNVSINSADTTGINDISVNGSEE